MRTTRDFDAIVVSISGGIDSLVTLLRAVERCQRDGTLDRLSVVHADMGEQEHEGSRALVEAQCKAFGVKLVVVSRNVSKACATGTCSHPGPIDEGSLVSQWAHKQTHSRVGPSTCQGTKDHKVTPIKRRYTEIASLHCGPRPCQILEVVGLAAHEGNARECRLQGGERKGKVIAPKAVAEIGGRWAENREIWNGRQQVTTWWPIADESKQTIWDEAARATLQYGADIDQATYAVLPRYSCQICPFASRDALNVQAQRNPELFERVVEIEKTWTRKWDSKFDLADVWEDVQAGRTVTKATTWGDQS
jgi:3'-phosphoadenosine 5'-phosphosulfate sulfotransferase (PAPS reductase)/FAD synthetase